MRASRHIASIAAIAVLLCASQGGAAANAKGVSHKGSLVELKFENRDGYTIRVAGYGQTVALSVIRHGQGRSSSATYLAHGTVTATSIRASFADLGSVSVHFQPSGRAIRPAGHARCGAHDDGVVGRRGLFVGGLRFHGEAGYTSATVHRAHGDSIDIRAFVACLRAGLSSERQAAQPVRRLSPGLPLFGAAVRDVYRAVPRALEVPTHPSPGPKPTTLSADGKLPLARTIFEARARGRGRVHFAAVDERSEGSVAIVRRVEVRAGSATFVADNALSLAGVTPPPPFSGTGAWQHTGTGEKSWTGSLAVSFLGAPNVPLAGPGFGSDLSRGW